MGGSRESKYPRRRGAGYTRGAPESRVCSAGPQPTSIMETGAPGKEVVVSATTMVTTDVKPKASAVRSAAASSTSSSATDAETSAMVANKGQAQNLICKEG